MSVLGYAQRVQNTRCLIAAGAAILILGCGGSADKEVKEPAPEEKPQEIEVVPLEEDTPVLPPRQLATLDPTGLETCKKNKHIIAVVTARTARIAQKGTRSERAHILAAVEQSIEGEAPADVEIRGYTSSGYTILEKGNRYIVCLSENARFSPAWELTTHEECSAPPAQCALAQKKAMGQ